MDYDDSYSRLGLLRSENISYATSYLIAMMGFGGGDGIEYSIWIYTDISLVLTLIVATLGSIKIVPWLTSTLDNIINRYDVTFLFKYVYLGWLCVLLIISMTWIAAGTYNPFIYFRF